MPYQYLTFFMEDDEELKRIGEIQTRLRGKDRTQLPPVVVVALCAYALA